MDTAFDAVTRHRPYHPSLGADESIAMLHGLAGPELDPACVKAFVRARKKGAILMPDERDEHVSGRPVAQMTSPPEAPLLTVGRTFL